MGFLDNTGVTRLVTDLKSKFTAPKSIAYVESTTAKTNHAVGSHFMVGEQLKRATSAIATGETIGTSNSADDTVQAQIDTLWDSVSKIVVSDDATYAQLRAYDDNPRPLRFYFGTSGGKTYGLELSEAGILFRMHDGTDWSDVWTK